MASKSLLTSWPLQLLLLVCLSWRTTLGQLDAWKESTTYVILSWNRPMTEWENKKLFNVSLESSNEDCNCHKVMNCTTPICYFNTLEMCGPFPPCSSCYATVYAVPYELPSFSQYIFLAPEKVTDLSLRQEEGVEHISWDNPSPHSSHCHHNTEVLFSYGNFSSSYRYPADKQNLTLPLCVAGSKHVEVRTVTNWTVTLAPTVDITEDSSSDATTADFTYDESEEDMLVHIRSAEPLSCTTGKVHWMLNTNCSSTGAYDYIKVLTGERQGVVHMADTSLEIPGVEIPKSYNTCVLVMKDELAMGADCINWEMKKNAVENLRVDANNSTSLSLLWQPSECPDSPPRYYVTLERPLGVADQAYTYNTTHTFVNLAPLTEYEACVHNDDYYTVCRKIYTLPADPRLWAEYFHIPNTTSCANATSMRPSTV